MERRLKRRYSRVRANSNCIRHEVPLLNLNTHVNGNPRPLHAGMRVHIRQLSTENCTCVTVSRRGSLKRLN